VLLVLAVRRDWPDLGFVDLLPGLLLAGPGQGFQLPVLLRIVLSDVPADRTGVGSGVMVTAQSLLAVGVATPGTLFLTVSPGLGTGNALVVTMVQLGVVGVTGLLNLRLPRVVS
jgi:hypothetical protein